MSSAQISTLFIIWSLTSFVFEVPSGAWADTVDRRHLLVAASVVYAGAFASWLVLPSFAGFALGFVLWGVSGAMMSGTFESLLYDEMSIRGLAGDYPRLMGFAHSAAMLANLVAAGLAVPLLEIGGYRLVGWVSVALTAGQTVLAATLPASREARRPRATDLVGGTERMVARYVGMLRSGIREATGSVAVRRVVLIAAVLVGFTAYDEYFPLVAADHGVPVSSVPPLIALTVAGQAAGTALAGRTSRLAPRTLAAIVLLGGALISAGCLVTPYAGFVGIAVGYGLLNNAMVVAEARLQQVISGPARATVTSVYGLASEIVALAVYGSFAVAAGLLSVPQLVALLGIPIAFVAWGVGTWFPPGHEPGSGVSKPQQPEVGVEDSASGAEPF